MEDKNVKLKKSRIRELINDSLRGQEVSKERLTDAIWEYIEGTMKEVDYPITFRFIEEE